VILPSVIFASGPANLDTQASGNKQKSKDQKLAKQNQALKHEAAECQASSVEGEAQLLDNFK
jgi:hypothetical protein